MIPIHNPCNNSTIVIVVAITNSFVVFKLLLDGSGFVELLYWTIIRILRFPAS